MAHELRLCSVLAGQDTNRRSTMGATSYNSGCCRTRNLNDNSQQHRRVINGLERVSSGGDRKQFPSDAGLTLLAGDQGHPSNQYLEGGFAGALVLVELMASRERNEGLPQTILVTTVNGVRAAAT